MLVEVVGVGVAVEGVIRKGSFEKIKKICIFFKTPYTLPRFNIIIGVVAQLVRASACHAEGREFEPRQLRHFF